MALGRRSWISLSLPSRRVVLSLNLAFKRILFYAGAISCLRRREIMLSRVTESLPKGDDLKGCSRGLPPEKQSSVTRLSPPTQPPFLALTSCPHFPFQIAGDAMSSSRQPLIYLFLSFASRVPRLTGLWSNYASTFFALGFFEQLPFPQ